MDKASIGQGTANLVWQPVDPHKEPEESLDQAGSLNGSLQGVGS